MHQHCFNYFHHGHLTIVTTTINYEHHRRIVLIVQFTLYCHLEICVYHPVGDGRLFWYSNVIHQHSFLTIFTIDTFIIVTTSSITIIIITTVTMLAGGWSTKALNSAQNG